MAPVPGLEPGRTVLETVMLPLHHTDMAESVGFEPTEPLRFAHLANECFRPLSQLSTFCLQTLAASGDVYHCANVD